MTTEELLKPRWKVVALWPNTAYEVGEIIHIDSLPLPNSAKEFFNSYPHLFKPLAWWEYRKKGELPQYVKSNGEVFKALAWFDEDVKIEEGPKPKRFIAGGCIPIDTCLPATEAEYNSLNGGQNKKL